MEYMWTELVNSDHHDHLGTGQSEDYLKQPAWLAGFLRRWGVPIPSPSGQTSLAALTTLRGLLRRMAVALSKREQLSGEDLQVLNELLGASPAVRQLRGAAGRHGAPAESYRLEWVHPHQDWNLVLAEIVASFAESLARNEPHRFKLCQNPDCGWVFYDDSPNAARRWCENTCASLMKVRRYRARHRAS